MPIQIKDAIDYAEFLAPKFFNWKSSTCEESSRHEGGK